MLFNIWITGAFIMFGILQCDEGMRGHMGGLVFAIFWPLTMVFLFFCWIDEVRRRRRMQRDE